MPDVWRDAQALAALHLFLISSTFSRINSCKETWRQRAKHGLILWFLDGLESESACHLRTWKRNPRSWETTTLPLSHINSANGNLAHYNQSLNTLKPWQKFMCVRLGISSLEKFHKKRYRSVSGGCHRKSKASSNLFRSKPFTASLNLRLLWILEEPCRQKGS